MKRKIILSVLLTSILLLSSCSVPNTDVASETKDKYGENVNTTVTDEREDDVISVEDTLKVSETENDNIIKLQTEAPENTGVSDPQPVLAPIPPLTFNSMNDVIDVLKGNTAVKCRDDLADEYRRNIDVIGKAGYTYQPTLSDDVTLFENAEGKNVFVIMPCAAYEDAGIYYYVNYGGNLYIVIVYSPDEEIAADKNDPAAYIGTRFGIKSNDKRDVNGREICLYTEDESRNCVALFIDDTHYCVVKADTSKENVTDFIGNIGFDKIIF